MQKCPDCSGELETGAIVDYNPGGAIPARYGRIELSRQTGGGVFDLIKESVDFKDVRRVIAYRCQKCNRIFQYAQDVVVISDLQKQSNELGLKVLILTLVLSAVIIGIAVLAALG